MCRARPVSGFSAGPRAPGGRISSMPAAMRALVCRLGCVTWAEVEENGPGGKGHEQGGEGGSVSSLSSLLRAQTPVAPARQHAHGDSPGTYDTQTARRGLT